MKINSEVIDKVGVTTILTSVGINAAEKAQVIEKTVEWGLPDYALIISMIGGVLFIIEKLLAIRKKIRSRKKKS